MNDNTPLKVLIFSPNPQDGIFFEHILKKEDHTIFLGQVHTWKEFFRNTVFHDANIIFLEVDFETNIAYLNIFSKLQYHFPDIQLVCYFSNKYYTMIQESMLQQGAFATLRKPLIPGKIKKILKKLQQYDTKATDIPSELLSDPQLSKAHSYAEAVMNSNDESELTHLIHTLSAELKETSIKTGQHYRTCLSACLKDIYQAFNAPALDDPLKVIYNKYSIQLSESPAVSEEEILSGFVHDCNYAFNYSQKGLNKERINYAKELIHSFLENGRNITLNTIADEMFISPYYLSRSFKKIEGINFIDYLQNCRLEYAKFLLATSDISIENIAFQCGYNEVNSFRRLFRKKTGISPNNYRNSLKNNKS